MLLYKRRLSVDLGHSLSIRNQCALLSIHPSGWYYKPVGEIQAEQLKELTIRSFLTCCGAIRSSERMRSGPWTSLIYPSRVATCISLPSLIYTVDMLFTGRSLIQWMPSGVCRRSNRRLSGMAFQRSSTPIKGHSLLPRSLCKPCKLIRDSNGAWMEKAVVLTMYSLSGCGGRSNTSASTSMSISMAKRSSRASLTTLSITTSTEDIRVLTTRSLPVDLVRRCLMSEPSSVYSLAFFFLF